jgi:hypothetical protein
MEKGEEIEYLKRLRNSVFSMGFSKSNIEYLEKLIKSEYNRELSKKNPNKLYIKHLKLTIDRSLNDLINSRKKLENRQDEFKECKMDLWRDILEGLSNLE